MGRKLYRAIGNEKKLAGVCAGVGKYLDVDPVLLRIITVVTTLIGGAGLVAYIVAWILMPEEPTGPEIKTDTGN